MMTRPLTMKTVLKTTISSTLFISLLMTAGAAHPALALPQDGQVARGSASITTQPDSVNVNQTTDRAVINWRSFDIGAKESVNFAQPSASSVTLNRVSGSANPSQILGALNANGKIILVNPQGVFIGEGARVNVGGLVATSSDIKDDNFMNGQMTFDIPGNPNAQIVNKGNISITEGGLVALVGPNVTNTGLIQARLGRVHMASGDVFTIDLYGDGLITIQASDALTKQLIANSGTIQADGGEIILTAGAAKTTIDSLINMDGLLQANSVGEKNGRVLLASGDNGGTNVSGKISAQGTQSGEKGGAITVLGKNVTLADGAVLNASGKAGGGKIKVGGDFQGAAGTPAAQATTVAEGARLLANADENGNGGDVVVWSSEETVFAGSIEAKGGALGGNGGSVETSGANLSASGLVDASAVYGDAGLWLLDPYNLKITTGSGANVVKVSTIQNSLNNGTSVTISTRDSSLCSGLGCLAPGLQAGNIEIASSITKSNGGNATLTFKADNNITVDSGVSISSTKNKLNVVLTADQDNNGAGSVAMENGSSIQTNGGNISISGAGGTSWVGGVTLTGAVLNAKGGNISITGNGYSSWILGGSYGVQAISSEIKTAGSGTITIEGTGGNSGVGVGGFETYGVQLINTDVETTGNGRISITGQGGDSINALSINNYGLRLDGTTVLSKGGSDIVLSGTGGDNTALYSTGNDGLSIQDGSVVKTTSGAITLTGIAGKTNHIWGTNAYGIVSKDTNTIGGANDTGAISFIADTLKVSDHLKVQTSDNVTFKPYQANTFIGVANEAGTLQVTGAILDDVKAGHVTIGDLLTGTGTLSAGAHHWNTSASFVTHSGNIYLNGVQAMGNNSFLAVTQNGNIALGSSGGVSSTASGSSIVLAASHGHFTNGSTAGEGALSVAEGGRWLIYSSGPANTDTMNGLRSDFHRYSCTYGGACPELGTGNGNLYSYTPYLTLSLEDAILTYGDYYDVKLKVTGVLDADFMQDHISGLISYDTLYDTLFNHDVGTYSVKIGSASLVSMLGYGFIYDRTPKTIIVNPAKLAVVAQNNSKTYGESDPTLTYNVTGFKYSDTRDTVMTGALDRAAGEHVVAGGYAIGEGSLGLLSKNYVIGSYVGATFTINPASLTVSADNKSMVMGDGALPPLTYSYSGLVGGDTSSVFTGALTTDATVDSLVGSYGIARGTLSAGSDYTVAFTDGVLTITAPTDAINRASEQSVLAPLLARGLGHRGILLAMMQGAGTLSGLTPAAGGGRMMTPEELSNLAPPFGGKMMTPEELSKLEPSAGGSTGVVALIECDDNAPCQINQ